MTMPDMAARLAARERNGWRPQVMHQRWESLLFLHWRVAAARVEETLPAELTVDTFDGAAYVGVVPFFMRNVRPVGLPSVAGISNFQELNVRTYVFNRDGVPGVWFYSLSCNQPLAVALARTLTGLEYRHAKMSASIGEFIDYSCRRSGTHEAARFRYRGIGEAREPGASSFEFFVLERYYLFAQRAGSLIRGQVSHVPYRPRAAEVSMASALPARLDGFAELSDSPDHACFVDGFDVKIYGTEKLA